MSSNIIKSYAIRYEPKDKMTIDHRDKDEELQARRISRLSLNQDDDGFTQGIAAAVVEPVIDEQEQQKKAAEIVEKAKKEAAAIIESAKQEARRLEQEARESGKKAGYEEGMKSAQAEIRQIKENLAKQQEMQQAEYKRLLESIEGETAELVISLLTKLTGIMAEDKKDVILYLVEKALGSENGNGFANGNGGGSCMIRVSNEDYDILAEKKDYIEGIVKREIQIVADGQLGKNQCLIETENRLIDCSLDVQLNNLVTDLKLLSGI
ncbi:MAG: hypothetical protein GX059_08720 [Clostridiales bacterium]|nr:hypothetical protein [Clostridiales bacterium]